MAEPMRCKCGFILPAAVCCRCDEGICPECGFVNDESFTICRTCLLELDQAAELARN